ncbi:MAG: hypothetical protein EPN39_18985 [Chitinophagaceae bacterium]|nr:MAG: hypothetical protein EPN39_18985 [Chitinophagaceae bacterium]
MTSLINTSGFWDNFLWPLLLAFVIGAFGLIWNFLIRKKFKITINHNQSFIGTNNGHDHAIIRVDFINKTSNPINNLRITTIPNYSFLQGISTMVGGGRFTQGGSTQIVFPAVADLTDDEIDARQPINIPAENNLEGNLVIDIQNRNNQITNIEFSYLTKRIRRQIRFNELQIRQL